MKKRNAIELTGVFIKDNQVGYTGFFSQFPEAVSQGETIAEAENNLFNVLPDVLELKKKMAEEDYPDDASKQVFRKSYSYQLAD